MVVICLKTIFGVERGNNNDYEFTLTVKKFSRLMKYCVNMNSTRKFNTVG